MSAQVRFGSRVETVKSIQWALIARGYELPRWGADGRLGSETWLSLADFAGDRGHRWSAQAIEEEAGIVPPAVLADLLGPEPRDEAAGQDADLADVVDLRPARQGDPPKTKRDARGAVVVRDPSAVTGIVVHQTAAVFGVNRRQVARAGGDAREALRRRFLDVACHMAALRNGDVLQTNDLTTYVYHGNRLNKSTLGLEIEGRYPGWTRRPKRSTWGGDPSEVTDVIVAAARRALRELVERGHAEGMPIRYVYAHRQSSATRRSDPGEELWRRVVLDYAVPELGLKTRPRHTVGSGRPIPKAWDPAGYGPY